MNRRVSFGIPLKKNFVIVRVDKRQPFPTDRSLRHVESVGEDSLGSDKPEFETRRLGPRTGLECIRIDRPAAICLPEDPLLGIVHRLDEVRLPRGVRPVDHRGANHGAIDTRQWHHVRWMVGVATARDHVQRRFLAERSEVRDRKRDKHGEIRPEGWNAGRLIPREERMRVLRGFSSLYPQEYPRNTLSTRRKGCLS